MNETLTIGQLPQRFGLNTSAIRYYEASGVLPEPARVSGQRRYGPDPVRRLEVLDVAKRAGFSLVEARVLLQSADAGTPAFEALRELAAHKLPDVEALIERAQAMRAWLLTSARCLTAKRSARAGPMAPSGSTSRTSGAWPRRRGLVALEQRS